MSVIILDGHLKSALTCVRSLGASAIEIVCGAERISALACHSKFVERRFVYTSPKIDQKQFISDIQKEAKHIVKMSGEKPIVFCFSDATMLTLSHAYSELKEYLILQIPSFEAVELASDKARTYAKAQELTVPTITVYGEHESDRVVYPAVVKNRHSIVWKDDKSISGSADFVFSKEGLRAQYEKIKESTGEAPLVQEFVQGDEYGVEMVCDNGAPLATFVHKRIRSLSPRGGAAVVKETAEESKEVALMRTYAYSLASSLHWHGPVMVEFKINKKTGEVLLMEINGRWWGSLPLAVKAGVDFPMIAYRLARGEAAVKNPQDFLLPYTRTRHFLGDCKWLWSVFFTHDKLRPLLYPSRLRALYDFKKELFISKGDVFAWDDLKPSIMEYVHILMKK
jgi:predicted ATP-grasp superfamily ATP-dependent carboligase